MQVLDDTNVALGVTGSIAAVTTVELAHELRRRGADVRAVTTPASERILHPWALEFATGNPVVTEITGAVEHVDLCGREGWADALLIAPCTANTVGKVAAAVDDTPVTTCATTALGADVPVVVAPAMHEPMYDHPGVLEAIERLESWGVSFVEPRIEEGKAKIAAAESVVLGTARAAGDRPLADREVVVTAGATSERVDPVRALTNRSSGKTGRAVAKACHALGAEVTLVHADVGPGPLERAAAPADPRIPYADLVSVESGADLREATLEACEDADALVSAAAVSDYTVAERGAKIRSGQRGLSLDLEPAPKVLDAVREAHPDLTMVGFKAESTDEEEALIEAARDLRERADLAFVVANDASAVMGSEETRALLVRGDRVDRYGGPKSGLGLQVARELAER